MGTTKLRKIGVCICDFKKVLSFNTSWPEKSPSPKPVAAVMAEIVSCRNLKGGLLRSFSDILGLLMIALTAAAV